MNGVVFCFFSKKDMLPPGSGLVTQLYLTVEMGTNLCDTFYSNRKYMYIFLFRPQTGFLLEKLMLGCKY